VGELKIVLGGLRSLALHEIGNKYSGASAEFRTLKYLF
jgi:hypothetical protein